MHNYNRAMKIDPKNPGLYSAIALLYQDAKDYVTANLYYDKAIALKPDPETYLSKATVLMSMLVYKEAVNVLMKAIALDDKFLKGYITLANCYSSMKDFDNADKYFEKCYELDPNFYQAYVCHGISYSDEKRTNLAIKKYEEAIKINPNMLTTMKTNSFILKSFRST